MRFIGAPWPPVLLHLPLPLHLSPLLLLPLLPLFLLLPFPIIPLSLPPLLHPPSSSDFLSIYSSLPPPLFNYVKELRSSLLRLLPSPSEWASLYEGASFPRSLLPSLSPFLSSLAPSPLHSSLLSIELARHSAGLATFLSILQPICISSLQRCGSEQQQALFLPPLLSLKKIGAFCLTEPQRGSDASALLCEARREGEMWRINGRKRWIGNGAFADVLIVWASCPDAPGPSPAVLGFIVEKGAAGLSASKIERKAGLRDVENADILFDGVLVSDSQRLPLASSFATGPGASLFQTRLAAAAIALGTALGAYERAASYTMEREEFGAPLCANQLIQAALVTALMGLQSLLLLIIHSSSLLGKGQLTMAQVAGVKYFTTSQCLAIVGKMREIMGGNGLLYDVGLGRALNDIHAIHTYEGTAEMNMLIAGREITKMAAFRPQEAFKREKEEEKRKKKEQANKGNSGIQSKL